MSMGDSALFFAVFLACAVPARRLPPRHPRLLKHRMIDELNFTRHEQFS
jgi:hypothetical protein